jgi:hypothetical protein
MNEVGDSDAAFSSRRTSFRIGHAGIRWPNAVSHLAPLPLWVKIIDIRARYKYKALLFLKKRTFCYILDSFEPFFRIQPVSTPTYYGPTFSMIH